jgi:hypothetical protein
MFWSKTPVSVPKKERFIVFIALKGNEGIPENCPSHDEMMKKYWKYTKIIKESQWLEIDDAMVKVERIKYIRFIVQ